MKKTILLIMSLSILSFSSLFAQNITYGARAGVSLSTLTGDEAEQAVITQYAEAVTGANITRFINNLPVDIDLEQILTLASADPKVLPSFFVGGYANFLFTDRFQLEPGLYLASRGYQVNNTVAGLVQVEVTNRAYYLELPVYARVFLTDELNVFAGPQLSVLLSNNFNTQLSAFIASTDFDRKASDNLNKVDIGLALGVGYQLPVGFNIQAGYDIGLIPFSEDVKAYNGVWKLGVGYSF